MGASDEFIGGDRKKLGKEIIFPDNPKFRLKEFLYFLDKAIEYKKFYYCEGWIKFAADLIIPSFWERKKGIIISHK